MRTTSTRPPALRRRDLLLAAMMGPAAARASWPARHSTVPPAQSQGLSGVVIDERFAPARAFAARADRHALRSFRFAGEMSGLWFDQIRPVLQATPWPLVGLTGIGALFCFEQLAWDVGLRVHLRINHLDAANGPRHVAGSALSPLLQAQLDNAGPAFGAPAFDVALGCRDAWRDCTHAPVPPAAVSGADALVTWVIAPRSPL